LVKTGEIYSFVKGPTATTPRTYQGAYPMPAVGERGYFAGGKLHTVSSCGGTKFAVIHQGAAMTGPIAGVVLYPETGLPVIGAGGIWPRFAPDELGLYHGKWAVALTYDVRTLEFANSLSLKECSDQWYDEAEGQSIGDQESLYQEGGLSGDVLWNCFYQELLGKWIVSQYILSSGVRKIVDNISPMGGDEYLLDGDHQGFVTKEGLYISYAPGGGKVNKLMFYRFDVAQGAIRDESGDVTLLELGSFGTPLPSNFVGENYTH
jgi:hypothetical protein